MIYTNTTKDITYTPDGDLMFTDTGDVKKSGMDGLQVLCETIQRRLSHNEIDWKSAFAVSSNLDSYLGLEANVFNVNLINSVIRDTITSFRLLDDNEVALTPQVIEGNNLFFGVSIRVDYDDEQVDIIIRYDTRENSFQVKYLNQKAVR